jgi:hypothetical protein
MADPFGKYGTSRASTRFFAFLGIFFRFWEGSGIWHACKLLSYSGLGFGTVLHI